MTALESHHDENPALARKRRIKKLRAAHRDNDGNASKRQRTEDSTPDEEVMSSAEVEQKPSIRGIKRQARYEPGVPMSREELAAWRKEARRVRNRESAAASRKKTRERIEELETEVASIKSKYEAALQRIIELENDRHDSETPDILTQDLMEHRQIVSPTTTPDQSPAASPVSAPLSPTTFFSLELPDDHQHIMDTIIRPTAV